MVQNHSYPALEINLPKILHNINIVVKNCHQRGISVVGVTKGFSALGAIVEVFIEGGVDLIGDSRIQNLEALRKFPIEKMLLRLPMESEIEDVINFADYSLNSELSTIEKLNLEAQKQMKIHKVILMADMGDLREGIFDITLLENTIEKILPMSNIQLVGLGTNMKCYGGVLPTLENMESLVTLKIALEQKIGIELPITSGGNSSAYYLVENQQLLPQVNQLRLGESLILGNERAFFNRIAGTYDDAFILHTQLIELQKKPSVPVGIIGNTTFDSKPIFEDKGMQLRGIAAVGKQDVQYSNLFPLDPNIQIMGGSSDHLILDFTHTDKQYQVGDIVSFRPTYYGIVQLTTSQYVSKTYIH